jgi:diacylglycerol kinase (ATP)
MKYLIILNPTSQHGKALELKDKLVSTLKGLDLDFTLHVSNSPSDVTETVKKNLDNYTNFISFGGDGTIHSLANILVNTDKNLGCIPMGSGNDIARNLNIPLEMEAACQVLKNCLVKRIDMGLINSKYYYLAIAGAGFDSVVNDLANNTRFPIKGPAKYTYAVYKTLITFRSKKFHMKYDGMQRTVDAMFLVVGNMASYGGGMKITPDADPEDGILDVCIIKRMSKLHFIKIFPSVFKGEHVKDSCVEILRAENVEIDSEYNFSVFADGEYICKLPVKFEVAKESLNFIVGAK